MKNQQIIKHPVLLCGMMGAGKSTIGKKVAKLLGLPFSDLDAVIEEKEGRSIPEIFSESGEAAFRSIERDLLVHLARNHKGVLALGGGSLQNQHVVDHIKLYGWLVFLDAPLTDITSRLLKSKNRPMLENNDKETVERRVSELMAERLPLYRQAHITIKTGGISRKKAAAEIVKKLKLYDA